MNVFAELPEQQLESFAGRLERGEYPAGPRRIAGEPCFGKLEDVEARYVGDRILDGRRIELALGQQQRELLHFLLCREQVALGGVGQKLQRIGGGTLLLPGETRADPARQLFAL